MDYEQALRDAGIDPDTQILRESAGGERLDSPYVSLGYAVERLSRVHDMPAADIARALTGGQRMRTPYAFYSALPTEAQRVHELQPLADALALFVRGGRDAKVEQTGGHVYCATIMLGGWQVYATEDGWSVTDEDGAGIGYGSWYGTAYTLTIDPETGALDPDECEAAVQALAGTLADLA